MDPDEFKVLHKGVAVGGRGFVDGIQKMAVSLSSEQPDRRFFVRRIPSDNIVKAGADCPQALFGD